MVRENALTSSDSSTAGANLSVNSKLLNSLAASDGLIGLHTEEKMEAPNGDRSLGIENELALIRCTLFPLSVMMEAVFEGAG